MIVVIMVMENNITMKHLKNKPMKPLKNKPMKQTAVEWLLENLISEPLTELNIQHNVEVKILAKAMEKEQMIKFAEYVATYPDKNKNANGDILHAKSKYDGAERTVDLLEIFKQQDL